MKFTGRNLELVRSALDLALEQIRNQIATCPDPQHYAQDLDNLNVMAAEVARLLKRVDLTRFERDGVIPPYAPIWNE